MEQQSVYNELCRDFSEFIEESYSESGASENFDGGIYIKVNQRSDKLIKFCLAKDINETVKSLDDFLEPNNLFRSAEVYHFGEAAEFDKSSFPSGEYHVTQFHSAWFYYPNLLYRKGVLSDHIRTEWARILTERLKLETGDGTEFRKLVRAIFKFCLCPMIKKIDEEVPTLGNERRIDIRVTLSDDSLFRKHLSADGLRSNHILIETKNCKKNERDFVSQIADYLGPAKTAEVGLLITRSAISQKHSEEIPSYRRSFAGKCTILPMHDEHLLQIIANAQAGNFHLNEQLLIDLFDKAKADVWGPE